MWETQEQAPTKTTSLYDLFLSRERVNMSILRYLKMKRLSYAMRDPYVSDEDPLGAFKEAIQET